VPTPPIRAVREARRQLVESDREFTAKLEASLPDKAMVMQIPAYAFPEMSYPALGVGDHLRPFLYSRDLRFSFGGIKGRAPDVWFSKLGQLSFPEALQQIRRRGYQALYFNRNAFPDRGTAMLATLADRGFRQVIESRAGDLVCVPL
jgi:phosphoglycerol transferase